MLAGNERDALLRVANQLSEELGFAAGEEIPKSYGSVNAENRATTDILNTEDEQLVAGLREGLARVAAALERSVDSNSDGAIGAALDGSEMVIRGELLLGNEERLPGLLPSFVFLVALPVVDQDKALELSKRAALLVEEKPA